MRNISKAKTLENMLPILSVESGCIISKEAEITIGFRVELPELFTVTSEDYQAIHSTWNKAIKVLPDYTIIHKQDWFVEKQHNSKSYKNGIESNAQTSSVDDNSNYEDSFLSQSFEKHFHNRPYLSHSCYLYITKTTKLRARQQSNFNTLCRGHIIPKEISNHDEVAKFIESVTQLQHIINDSPYIKLHRLTDEEITGDSKQNGVISDYLSLSQERGVRALEDMDLQPDTIRIGDRYLSVHAISDAEQLPSDVGTDMRYEKLSTDKSSCNLSFAAPVGVLLSCNHIYNQYIFIDNHEENLKQFEKMARNMHSLSRYSRANQINKQWIDEYLNEAHSNGVKSVRIHANVMAWSDKKDDLQKIRNEVASNFALMGCQSRHNTVDAATLYWAGIAGNQGDFPSEETLYTFAEHGVCLFSQETNYHNSLSPFGIKMVDRVTGKPLHLDISDLPMKQGIITNRNKFVLGPSGSGKSFFTNHMVRQYYEQGTHVLLVDTGNSYKGLCDLIHNKTKGEDGVYFTYTEDNPIAFNPFYTEDKLFDIEKRESIKTLILTLWKRDDERPTRSEEVALSNGVNLFIKTIESGECKQPSFNTFYEFIGGVYQAHIEAKNVREKDFDIANFLNVLEPYYRGGEYDYLLNSTKDIDLINKRFIVFELDNIKDHKVLFPIVTIIIMETFINKMRRLKGVRKMILIEEAWKAIAKEGMAEYIKYLFKTVRKFFGEAVVVTQEVDDIITSPIVKESIINNSDCKILLDQRKYMNKFDAIQEMLGLSDKERSQILSINLNNHPDRKYKEVWIGMGGEESAVYATEVSLEEYFSYTTEEVEKLELQKLTDANNGDIQKAIKELAKQKRESN